MKKDSLKFFVFMLFIGVLILSACNGSSGGDQEGDSSSTEDKTTPQGTMPDRPFVFLSQQIIDTIDPAKNTDETSSAAVINMYDSLVYPDIENGTMNPVSNLADTWEVSEDGLTYTFKLREDVQFHSGNKMTAEDVVYSMQRMLSIQQGNSWMFSEVLKPENVKKVEEYTVEFTLDSPYAPFISTLTQLYVLDSKLLKENTVDGNYGEHGDYGEGYLEENTAGSGPYNIVSYDPSAELKLTRFEEYWKGWEDDQIEEISIKVVPEEATVKTLLGSGEADMANQWLSTETYQNFKNTEGVEVVEDVDTAIFHIPMHTQKTPLDDVNVRKAIAYAFDYETAVTNIMDNANQARGPVSESIPGHNKDTIQYTKDIEKAKELLSKSKYADEDLKVEFVFIGEFPQHRQMGQLLQSSLAEIGIEVELKPDTWANITDITSNIETSPHMFIVSAGLRYPHVDAHTFGMYHPSNHGSYLSASWYDNIEVSSLLEEARVAVDPDEQLEKYAEAQKIIADEAPSIYIANPTHRIAFRDYISDYQYVGIIGYDLNFYYLKVNK